MRRVVLLMLMIATGYASSGQSAIGQWLDHNSFIAVRKVCVGEGDVYAATRMSLFRYDVAENVVQPMTKVNGLTDVGISTMAYNPATQMLAVAYNNSGLDLVHKGQVHHIADIHYSGIGGDKKVYNIRFNGRKVYLATGFGVVVVDADRHEIEETYYLGPDGESGVVYDIAFTDSLVVAATDRGMMTAPKGSQRLHIYESWTLDTVSPLAGMSVRMLEVSPWALVAAACTTNPDSMTVFYQYPRTVFYQYAGSWDTLFIGRVRSLKCHNGLVILNRFNRIDIFNDRFECKYSLVELPEYGLAIEDVDVDANGTLWMGHVWAGLIQSPRSYTTFTSHSPVGPTNDDYVYSLTATSSSLYLCPGGKKPTYESALLPGSLSIYEKGEWSQITRSEGIPNYQDVLYMAVDPKDRKHISATSWGYGVLDIHNKVIDTLFDQTNSQGALVPFTSGSFTHLRVSGLAYDKQGNLWITNSLVDRGLVVRYHDGSWRNFDISPILQGLANDKKEIDKLVWDSVTDYKWFIGKANRIYVHDGVNKLAYVNPNNGSKLETHTVTCLVQDRSGDLWFGTDKGIKVIYDGYRAFANGGRGEMAPVNCSNILYNEDGINEYLMAYESITCMAVDGANRKWVGTSNNGLYLISANGLEQLHHFTTANSPLASDKIVALAVHPESGVVYVGTDMGLQSYRSTATVAYAEPMADIHAFPNPVRPGYDGPIAVKGFTRDALVHITDTRGHVVHSATAFGGQAVWDGRNQQGEPVASGTYFVFASDSAGNMRSVAKILILR